MSVPVLRSSSTKASCARVDKKGERGSLPVMVESMAVPLAARTVGPACGVRLERCWASVVVTKVPVAPESRMAENGNGGTSE